MLPYQALAIVPALFMFGYIANNIYIYIHRLDWIVTLTIYVWLILATEICKLIIYATLIAKNMVYGKWSLRKNTFVKIFFSAVKLNLVILN